MVGDSERREAKAQSAVGGLDSTSMNEIERVCFCGHIGCKGQGTCPLVECYHHDKQKLREFV